MLCVHPPPVEWDPDEPFSLSLHECVLPISSKDIAACESQRFVALPVFCNTFVEGRIPSQKDLAKINKDEFVKRN